MQLKNSLLIIAIEKACNSSLILLSGDSICLFNLEVYRTYDVRTKKEYVFSVCTALELYEFEKLKDKLFQN